MLDIVSHRARIGQFNAMKHRKRPQTRRLKYHTHLKILITLILMITIASAFMVWASLPLIKIPTLGQQIVYPPALGQQAAASSTSILLLCANWSRQLGSSAHWRVLPSKQFDLPAGGQPTGEILLKHSATPAHWGRPPGPIINEHVSPMIQPPGSKVHYIQQQI